MALLLGRMRRRADGIYSRDFIVNCTRFLWTIIVFLREIGSFFWAISSCSWPDSGLMGKDATPAHVLLVADAQVRLDVYGKRGIGLALYDSFLRRAWHVISKLRPHAIIFMGDMLAPGAAVADDAEYHQYHAKFEGLFRTDVPKLYLPGNHDVGLGLSSALSKQIRQQYSNTFGKYNQKINIKNHTLILLDSPGLVEEDYARAAKNIDFPRWNPIAGGSLDFFTRAIREPQTDPIILLTHIPLFRPDSAQCGPFREKGGIRRGVGLGYQNTLGKQTTNYLLEVLRPSAIFSADNRDHCEYTHTILPSGSSSSNPTTSVRETTVKSFSQARHIKRPGIQLLSLITPVDLIPIAEQQTMADRLCTLPDVSMSFTAVYTPLVLITLLALFWFNLARSRYSRHFRPPSLLSSPPSTRLNAKSPLHSPYLHPPADLATWSPAVWSPFTPVISSPKNTFPSKMRTPNNLSASTPTLQAFARPTSPNGSPLFAPIRCSHDDDTEDSLYPVQYATRALNNDFHDDDEDEEMRSLPFLPNVPTMSLGKASFAKWTYSFVIRGRRRGITLRIPKLSIGSMRWMFAELTSFGNYISNKPLHRSVFTGTLIDAVSVFWPVCVVWWMVIYWIF